ncbi:protein TolR [Acidiphilium acidophilum]|uniref:Protein TolR n=1 Tax=Acidiphilium acidophilum TaxID=76588 RepID=A0AAW9DLX3_ACIAO|nr:protein TolR [Acidiphilium acidophilum]MDX5930010.1 protein TolR [Acidiphilium acidophilum]GBQ07488.1 ExbD/TolR proton channel family protein [Acidiphilium acidophilum DSM 700]
MAGGLLDNKRGNRRSRYRPMAEINVTPLVDVMLVLLIVFMITAPLITSGVSVNLPQANAKPVNTDATPITITINAAGDVYLQNSKVALTNLVATLQQIAKNNTDRRIFVRGDTSVPYGTMLKVMATITDGGFDKVALLAQQPTPSAR